MAAARKGTFSLHDGIISALNPFSRAASLDDTCWTVLEAVSDVMGSLEYLSPSLTKLLLDSSKLLASKHTILLPLQRVTRFSELHGIVQLPKLLNNGQIRGIYKQAFQDTLEFMLQGRFWL
jgi:hypothetical protein